MSERLDTIYGTLSARVSLLWNRGNIAGGKAGVRLCVMDAVCTPAVEAADSGGNSKRLFFSGP
jgi:hypothetical protein